MDSIRDHWITGLSLFTAGCLLLVGAGVTFGGEDGISAWRVVYGIGSLVGAVAILAGLWGLRTGGIRPPAAYTLVGIGAVLFAVGYWWLVFVPPVIAAIVVYAGVFRRGLERELHPA